MNSCPFSKLARQSTVFFTGSLMADLLSRGLSLPLEDRGLGVRSCNLLQDGVGRIVTRGAGHFAARVGTGAAEVEAVDRRPVVGPTGERARREHLAEHHVEVADVAVGHADAPLDVGRGKEY